MKFNKGDLLTTKRITDGKPVARVFQEAGMDVIPGVWLVIDGNCCSHRLQLPSVAGSLRPNL